MPTVAPAYKILLKQKNDGYDAFVAAIDGLTIEQLTTAQPSSATGWSTLLEKAITKHALRIVTLLLDRGVPVKPKYPNTEPPLNIAVEKKDLPIVKLLLERGADPNAQRIEYSDTPLLLAARNKEKTGPAIIEALIDAGADPNKGVLDITPLRRAIHTGNKKNYNLLLLKGAKLNPLDITYIGVGPGSLEILKDLIARGVDINTINDSHDAVEANPGTVLHSVLSEAVLLWVEPKSKQALVMPILEHLAKSGIDWHIPRPRTGMPPLQYYLKLITGKYSLPLEDDDAVAYIDSIVIFLLSKGADINSKTKGITPLFGAVHNFDYKLTKKLIAWGADVNLDYAGVTPLAHAISIKWNKAAYKRKMIDILCSAPGIDVNKEQVDGAFPLLRATKQNDLETMARLLAVPGIQVNKQTDRSASALHWAQSAEAVKLLVDAGADVNLTTLQGPPLYFAAYFGLATVIEALLKVPEINLDFEINGLTILEHAEKNNFTKVPEINAFLVKLLTPPDTLWEGWTRADMDKFDIIFEDTMANEFSCCPVCLKYIERSEGCMYIREHNCTTYGSDYYHKKLYRKYKSPDGKIYWCTICGRISLGHRHYELTAANGPVPNLLVGHSPFATDCKGEGGGGRMEKVARIRRLREYALELQDDVGKKTFTTAMNELVEEMWNAPLVRKGVLKRIMEEKKWNIPANAFPTPPPPPAELPIDFANFPNLTRPMAESELVPTVVQGTDVILQEPDMEVIQFHHTQPDGTVNHHTITCISADSLTQIIAQSVGAFKTPDFGFCWEKNGCKGRLWPEEIKSFVPEELYNEYRIKFNWKFRSGVAGGAHRRTRHRQHGGHKQNIFIPATNAQCYLPKNTRRANRRNTDHYKK